MKINLFFLLPLFGVCFSKESPYSNLQKLIDDEEEITTTVKALRNMINTGTDIRIVCILFKRCKDIDFVSSIPRKKAELCSANDDCSDAYAFCSNYKCQCPENYLRSGTKCYGMLEARCTESSECLSTGLVCQNGLCLDPFEKSVGDTQCTQKSGTPVCWGTNPSGILCRVFGNNKDFTIQGVIETSPSGQKQCGYIWFGKVSHSVNFEYLQITDNMKWNNSRDFEMENAVYGGVSEGSQLTLFCKTTPGKSTFYGRLSPPNYDVCRFIYEGIILEYKMFKTLVYV